ncbi:MAG: type VI-A CRISPR-associated RNA-guided ribonuclease Cas13a, partial [Paracoccaceae bacterium]
MRNILRPKGHTQTGLDAESRQETERTLRRGLRFVKDRRYELEEFRESEELAAEELPSYLMADPTLVLRQLIAVLDKVIKKPRTLHQFNADAYVDRAKLAAELWHRYSSALPPYLEEQAKEDGALQRMWNWKVHPYAKKENSGNNQSLRRPTDGENPQNDLTYHAIRKRAEDNGKVRGDFNGRWHEAFWSTTEFGQPDYEAIAERIWDHLRSQDVKITGKPRECVGDDGSRGPTQRGLMLERGRAISTSTSDPRHARQKREERFSWSRVEEEWYLKNDVAAKIWQQVTGDRNEAMFANTFGQILYSHLGAQEERDDSLDTLPDDQRRRTWALHNAVRRYYKKLATSERFRRALRAPSADELERLLPRNGQQLMDILRGRQNDAAVRKGGKSQGAEISELIRVGKLVVHASDVLSSEPDLSAAFRKTPDHFATRAGQNEIKRNEAFARVWRNAMGLSQRTLRATVPDDFEHKEQDDVLSSAGSSAVAVAKFFDVARYEKQMRLVFGDKALEGFEDQSRASIFIASSETDEEAIVGKQEQLWALFTVARRLRNRTNHFCTKPRLVKLLTEGIATGADLSKLENMGDRKNGRDISETAKKRFSDLLDADLALRGEALRTEMARIEFTKYVPQGLRTTLPEELGGKWLPNVLTPRFISVIQRAKSLQKFDLTKLDDLLKPLAGLDTIESGLSCQGPEHFKIGALRLLYANGFQRWLVQDLPRLEIVEDFIKAVAKARLERVNAQIDDDDRAYKVASGLLEEIGISEIGNLDDFLKALTSNMAREERANETYRANRNKQQSITNSLERFRQDLFAGLFAAYLRNKDFMELFDVSKPIEAPEPLSEEEMPELEDWGNFEPWHAQFYAWLYLVPVDDIAMLQQQFRKTAALDEKSDVETNPQSAATLRDIDRLMSLYTKVHGAGFDGTEHLDEGHANGGFYQEAEAFADAYRDYADDFERQNAAFPGTRRGLRQIQRFGHATVVSKIFDKHKVTRGELSAIREHSSAETKALFKGRQDLHDEITAKSKQLKQPRAQLVTSYSERATPDTENPNLARELKK